MESKDEIKIRIRTAYDTPFRARGPHCPHCDWGTGYIGVPGEHPWYEKDYEELDVDIFYDLTFSDFSKKWGGGLWWLGFGTIHVGCSPLKHDEQFVRNETEKLRDLAWAAYLQSIIPHRALDDRNIDIYL